MLNVSHLEDVMANTQNPVKTTTTTKTSQKPQILPKTIKQPFWEEEQRAVLCKEIYGGILPNLDMKDLSLKISKFKTRNIKKYCNIWPKITSRHFILDIVKKSLKVNFNKIVVGKTPHLHRRKQKEVLDINLEV